MNKLKFYKIHGKGNDMNHNFKSKHMPVQKNPAKLIVFLVFLLIAYVFTTVGLLLLAFLLYKFPLTESGVNIGIILIYITSAFLSSFICGKKIKERKFLWGLGIGTAYFVILLLLSFLMNGEAANLGTNVFTALLICTGSGMLGGMLA